MPVASYSNFDLGPFIGRFMQGRARPFGGSEWGIQVFPLEQASELMRPPTPLFRTSYNFLLLFTAGGGRQQVDNELISLATNDVLFIREGHLNAILEVAPDTAGYFIYINNHLLSSIFEEPTLLNRFSFHPRHSVPGSTMEWLEQCAGLMSGTPASEAYQESIHCALLRAMMMKIAGDSRTALLQPDRPSEITMRFKELVYEHFTTSREVSFYAKHIAVSQNYLSRCVKQVTGKSPKQHINEFAIHSGKVLLLDRSRTVAEIAFDLNFTDAAYFGRLFRRLTGQSPTEYRSGVMHGLSAQGQRSS